MQVLQQTKQPFYPLCQSDPLFCIVCGVYHLGKGVRDGMEIDDVETHVVQIANWIDGVRWRFQIFLYLFLQYVVLTSLGVYDMVQYCLVTVQPFRYSCPPLLYSDVSVVSSGIQYSGQRLCVCPHTLVPHPTVAVSASVTINTTA